MILVGVKTLTFINYFLFFVFLGKLPDQPIRSAQLLTIPKCLKSGKSNFVKEHEALSLHFQTNRKLMGQYEAQTVNIQGVLGFCGLRMICSLSWNKVTIIMTMISTLVFSPKLIQAIIKYCDPSYEDEELLQK